jgi:hypothetical protein
MSNILRWLIVSIDVNERKYVQIQLENSNSFKFRSEISNQNEIEYNALEDRISRKRVVSEFWHQSVYTKLNQKWVNEHNS